MPSRPKVEVFEGVSYEAIDPGKFAVSIVARDLAAPARIKITPDNKYLLAAQLTGEVIAWERTADGWQRKAEPVIKIETQFPGFPPDEGGLTGIVFSSRYDENGKIFLLYAYRDEQKKIWNRISVADLNGTPPKMIWQANVEGNVSHQITDGWGVEVNNQPYLVFLVGEGFDAKRAQDPTIEAGKVMLVAEDGTDGRVAAVGLRNGYTLARNLYDNTGRFLLADTGPDHWDRLIYTKFVDIKDRKMALVNLGWNGEEASLKAQIPDPNFPKVTDMVLTRLEDTQTFTGLAFHPGSKAGIPRAVAQENNVLAAVFGKTGSKSNSPGKEIWLGRLKNILIQPTLEFAPIVRRAAAAEGYAGNPVGLEVDGQTGNIYFGDIMEGRIYKVEVK